MFYLCSVKKIYKNLVMNNSLGDLVLNYLCELSSNPAIIFPLSVWVLSVWRVCRLRPATHRNQFGISPDNYVDSVNESVAETVQEQIAETIMKPLFINQNIILPPGKNAYDVVDDIMSINPLNLEYLSEMYNSLSTLGADSPFFEQALLIVQSYW